MEVDHEGNPESGVDGKNDGETQPEIWKVTLTLDLWKLIFTFLYEIPFWIEEIWGQLLSRTQDLVPSLNKWVLRVEGWTKVSRRQMFRMYLEPSERFFAPLEKFLVTLDQYIGHMEGFWYDYSEGHVYYDMIHVEHAIMVSEKEWAEKCFYQIEVAFQQIELEFNVLMDELPGVTHGIWGAEWEW